MSNTCFRHLLPGLIKAKTKINKYSRLTVSTERFDVILLVFIEMTSVALSLMI